MDKKSIIPFEELLDSIRDTDGFPIGKDEDILALSDPPFYTACPNPYIKQFIDKYGKPYDPDNDDYHREPFVDDVRENKYDSFYKLHPYPTKVPYKAIENYIMHYTSPGDIVFDGFCGTGMTGIATKMNNRRALLNDLCPSATFIAYNFNTPIIQSEYKAMLEKIYRQVEDECSWMFITTHKIKDSYFSTQEKESLKGKINYVVWSDVFTCPYCSHDYIFYECAVDLEHGKVLDSYTCPSCSATINKRESKKPYVKYYDSVLNKTLEQQKQVPILINYTNNNKRYIKKVDEYDLKLIEKIEQMEIPYWYPINQIILGDKTSEPINRGLTHIHHFYSKRNLWIMASFYSKIPSEHSRLKFIITKVAGQITKMYRYTYQNGTWGAGGGPLSGTYYIPSLQKELSILKIIKKGIGNQIKTLKNVKVENEVLITNQSSTNLELIPENSIDFIFTDPPFGGNLMYTELNFLWESWLKVIGNNKHEAIINNTQNKGIEDYTHLMTRCFTNFFRILKPNRWIVIEFHNSKAAIWNCIQESITRSGFIIAQVAILDKVKGTYNQTNASGAVKNDLVITAYKPKENFTFQFLKNSGEGMEVDFVAQQLEHLPVRLNIERTEKMLYSKMLAHYIENGFKIKYDSINFYKLLSDNFIELDGYWFLDSQVKEYNEWKSGLSLDKIKEVLDGQQVLFVSDEKSALTWLYNFLHQPRTYSEIFTAYQQVATTTDDRIPELRELVENNFIVEDGKYRRPIGREEREEINKNREKELDRAFQRLLKQAKEQKGKIKNIRREALVHGFTKCYQEGRYDDILTVADRLYASTLEASGDIMDFIDIARIKTSGETKTIED